MTPPVPQPKLDVVLERLENLKSGQQSLAMSISSLSCDFRTSQLNYVKAHEELSKDEEHTMKRVTTLEGEIEDLKPVKPTLENNSKRLDVDENEIKEIKRTHEDYAREIDQKIIDLTNAISPLIFANRIAIWIYGAVGLSVISLIIGILTGRVDLIFH